MIHFASASESAFDLRSFMAEPHHASDKHQAEFYAAFGEFIDCYARVEAWTHLLFRHLTTLNDEAARAIGGGARMVDLMSMTKRLATAMKSPHDTEIERLFSQIGEISKLRHAMVHRGVMISEDEIRSTNLMTAKSAFIVDTIRFTLPELKAATLDLLAIFLRIGWLVNPPNTERDTLSIAFAHAPWRYKFRVPELPSPKRRASARSRQRQPRS